MTRKKPDKRENPTKWQLNRWRRIVRIYHEKFDSNNAAMARALWFEWPDYVRFICNPHKSGGRWIGEDTARAIEEKLGLPEHWLDYPEAVADTTIAIHALVDQLTPANQEILVSMLRVLVEQQHGELKQITEQKKLQGSSH